MRLQHLHKSQSPPRHLELQNGHGISFTPVSQAYENTEFSPVECYEVHIGNLTSECKWVLGELTEVRAPIILIPLQKVIPGQKSSPPSAHLQSSERQENRGVLSLNHTVILPKRCREAKPSNVVQQSWTVASFSWPNSFFPGLQKWDTRHSTYCTWCHAHSGQHYSWNRWS